MKLAISLLNRNGLEDTIQCVDSLLVSDFQDYTIYLLDNGSDNSQEYSTLQEKYKWHSNVVMHSSSLNLWFTWGNNYNINLINQTGSFDYVMLLNNDCRVEPNFLTTFFSAVQDSEKQWIFGPIIKSPGWEVQAIGSFMNLFTGSSTRLKDSNQTYQVVDYVTWSCILISNLVLQKVWLLDDRFFAYWEESDYCFRAKKAWIDTYSLHVDGIYHKEEAAQKKVKPYYTYLMFRNRLLFLQKHATIFQYIISWFFLIGYSIFFFPKYFWIKNYKYLRIAIKDWVIGKYGSPSFT